MRGRLRDCPAHILGAIERIERYADDKDEIAFIEAELVQDAVIRNFEITGEATRNITRRFPDFGEARPVGHAQERFGLRFYPR